MSYRPKQASLPSSFKKAESNKNNSGFKQFPRSRIVTIDGYEIDEKDPTQSVMLATEMDTGRKIKAKLNPDKVARGIRSPSDKWSGNLIDTRMQKALKPGEVVVLERCITEKNIKSGGEIQVSLMRCDWVKPASDPSPDKTFRAVFTVGAFDNRARGVQQYDRDARNINPATEEGDRAIEELGARMDEIVAQFRAGERPIPLGVKFHAMVQVDEKDGAPVYQVINKSPPFDWVRSEKDSEDNVISEGHPIDKENLEGWLSGYLDYVYGSEDQSAEDAEPGLVKRGVAPKDKEIVVEVMVYRALPCSALSPQLDISNERSPLARICNVMSKFALEDDRLFVGKNWGVDGIVMLTSDQPPEKGQTEWKPRNLVTNLFVDGYQADIHTMMKAHDGGSITVHPELTRVRDNDASYGTNNQNNEASEKAPSQAPVLQAAAVDFDADDDGDGSSYFADAVRVGDTNEGSSAENSSEDTSTKPVEEKSDEQASTDKPEKKATGRGRFTRST